MSLAWVRKWDILPEFVSLTKSVGVGDLQNWGGATVEWKPWEESGPVVSDSPGLEAAAC